MNISDGKHIDLEDIDTIIHEEESKHNPNNDQIDTGDGDDDDDTILDNSGNIKVEDTLYQFKVTVNTKELGLTFGFPDDVEENYVLNYFTDACFILDIILCFRSGFYTENGQLVMNKNIIRDKYIQGILIITTINR